MAEKTYYLDSLYDFISFSNKYELSLSGCPVGENCKGMYSEPVTLKNMPKVMCLEYRDRFGEGRPDVFCDMLDKKSLEQFVNNIQTSLGLQVSPVVSEFYGISFRIWQGEGIADLVANYSWSSDKKEVFYRYMLECSSVVIGNGYANIEDRNAASFIKHFIKTIKSIDLTPYFRC